MRKNEKSNTGPKRVNSASAKRSVQTAIMWALDTARRLAIDDEELATFDRVRVAVLAWQHGRDIEIDPGDVFVVLAIVIGAISFEHDDDDPAVAVARACLHALFLPGASDRLPPIVIRRRRPLTDNTAVFSAHTA
ncbi:MAG: hypothetical protein KIT31_16235 [Deltaproteobacteria bacterium]|nr:hypothetical protein [Deltaproteobacteria bacterium]